MFANRWLVASAGSLIFGMAPAEAQTSGRSGLEFGVSGTATYDSNISHTSRTLAATRGLSRSDYRFTPSLTVDGTVPLGRQTLSLSGMLGYDFYARNSRLNRERVVLDSVLGLQFGRCTGDISGSYSRRQSELGDLVLINPNGVLDGRVKNVEDVKTIGASASCGGTVGLRPNVSIQQSWVDNSVAIRSYSNSNSTRVSGGVSYVRPSFGELSLFGSYGRTRYPDRDGLITIGGGRGNETMSGGLRYERQIGSQLRGLAELSYSKVDASGVLVRNFSGLTWRLNATADVGSRLQLMVDVSRSVQASNRVDANYTIEKLYSIGADYALGDRVSLTAGAAQRQRSFRGTGLLTSPLIIGPSLVNDRLRTFRAGIAFRQSQRLRLSLDGFHETRDANSALYEYSSNRVSLTASTSF